MWWNRSDVDFFRRQETRRTPDLDRSAPVYAQIRPGQIEWNEDQQFLNETTGLIIKPSI